LLYRNHPKAKCLFLYREAESWARSSARAFLASGQANEGTRQEFWRMMTRFVPLLPGYMAKTSTGLSATEFLALIWLSIVQRYMALYEQGLQVCATRYEDLMAAPEEVTRQLFQYYELPLPEPARLAQVLAKDSQAGSVLSQASLRQPEAGLDETELAQLRAFLQAEPVINTPDFVAPGTLKLT
jgi:hypothetical protein